MYEIEKQSQMWCNSQFISLVVTVSTGLSCCAVQNLSCNFMQSVSCVVCSILSHEQHVWDREAKQNSTYLPNWLARLRTGMSYRSWVIPRTLVQNEQIRSHYRCICVQVRFNLQKCAFRITTHRSPLGSAMMTTFNLFERDLRQIRRKNIDVTIDKEIWCIRMSSNWRWSVILGTSDLKRFRGPRWNRDPFHAISATPYYLFSCTIDLQSTG